MGRWPTPLGRSYPQGRRNAALPCTRTRATNGSSPSPGGLVPRSSTAQGRTATQDLSSLPWHLYHPDVITWLSLTRWSGDCTLAQNIRNVVLAHHELVALVHQEARVLQGRLGGDGVEWWSICYRHSLVMNLLLLRYQARCPGGQKG